ncbi:MAG: CBS domain-containing protein [Gemmatimonadaceae bacterium]
MQASEIMTRDPAWCTPDHTVRDAARLMQEHDCGCIPVVDEVHAKRLVGVVTDRDLACRCLAAGLGPDTTVAEVMSVSPSCCAPEDDVQYVERIMEERQVRRVPVIDDRGCCVGMVSQADLVRAAERSAEVSDREVARMVERVSAPLISARRESEVGLRPQ